MNICMWNRIINSIWNWNWKRLKIVDTSFVYTSTYLLNSDAEEYNKDKIYGANIFAYDSGSAYENGVGSLFT